MARRSGTKPDPGQGSDEDQSTQTSGPDAGKAETARKCIVSGDLKPKAEMIRFVVGPEGDIVPDLDEKLPGRGLWLSAEADVLKTACVKNSFARAARRGVKVPDGLSDRVEALLAKRCLNLIGMAKRAGLATAGYEKVRIKLKSGKAGVLLAASDGASDGRDKIRALAPDALLLDMFSSDELGQALGREHVVHGVINPGGLADKLVREAAKIAGFRLPVAAKLLPADGQD